MTHHFIWGFQFNPVNPLLCKNLKQLLKTIDYEGECRKKWESRFFWPDNSVVILNNLPPLLLQLNQYKIKSRQDSYILKGNLNIKLRKNKVHYKALIQQQGNCYCYAKKDKIKLQKKNKTKLCQLIPQLSSWNEELPFKQFVEQFHTIITLDKEILIHSLTPTVRLEFSRIQLNNHYYLSFSLESFSRQSLEELVKLIIPMGKAQSYTDFLSKV